MANVLAMELAYAPEEWTKIRTALAAFMAATKDVRISIVLSSPELIRATTTRHPSTDETD